LFQNKEIRLKWGIRKEEQGKNDTRAMSEKRRKGGRKLSNKIGGFKGCGDYDCGVLGCNTENSENEGGRLLRNVRNHLRNHQKIPILN
jgi:hypothetical protein